jgi:hypothetical protein
LDGDGGPGRDLTVATVLGWDDPPEQAAVLADFDPLRLEARLADALQARARAAGAGGEPPPRDADGTALWRWLTDAKTTLEGTVAFSAEKAVLPARREPEVKALGEGRTAVEVERPDLWEAWEGGGIPDLLASVFPDPSHPAVTASRLAELLSGSVLHVSDTSAGFRTWEDRAARFFASH